MSKFIFWAGIIFFLGSIILIVSKSEDLRVQKNGTIVKMRIEKMPKNCLGGKAYYFATLSYNGTTYDKRIGGNFCDKHHVGELIDIKYLKESSVVLFPEESVMKQIYLGVALGLFGLVIVVIQWKKIKR